MIRLFAYVLMAMFTLATAGSSAMADHAIQCQNNAESVAAVHDHQGGHGHAHKAPLVPSDEMAHDHLGGLCGQHYCSATATTALTRVFEPCASEVSYVFHDNSLGALDRPETVDRPPIA